MFGRIGTIFAGLLDGLEGQARRLLDVHCGPRWGGLGVLGLAFSVTGAEHLALDGRPVGLGGVIGGAASLGNGREGGLSRVLLEESVVFLNAELEFGGRQLVALARFFDGVGRAGDDQLGHGVPGVPLPRRLVRPLRGEDHWRREGGLGCELHGVCCARSVVGKVHVGMFRKTNLDSGGRFSRKGVSGGGKLLSGRLGGSG